MATVPKPQLKKITINGSTVSQNLPITNDEMVELHVADFKGHKFCCLQISAVDYTDTESTTTMKTMASATGSQPLGTIKIGS